MTLRFAHELHVEDKLTKRNTRVILMATPEFGVPTLRAVVSEGYHVVGVVCQPDKPAGRGMQMSAPPVKRAALPLGLPVYQWASLRQPEALETMAGLRADLILVAAYGQYIPDEVVALPPRRCLNLHPSLLPRHRGASPVAAAILAGDAETGVTVLFVTAEMDAGDVLAQERTPIGPEETTGTLTARLAQWGAGAYMRTVDRWLRGEIVPWKQDANQSTWCDRLTKEQGRVDWHRPAVELARQVRAFDPWPGTFTEWQSATLNVLKAAALPDWRGDIAAGTVLKCDGALLVATGQGALRLESVQLANRRALDAMTFANGARGFVGSVLG